MERKVEKQGIWDSTSVLNFYKDKDNRMLKVNKAFAEAMGLSKAAIEGKSCLELWPEGADGYWRDDKDVIAAGVPKRNILELFKTPQGERWLRTDRIPYKNEQGEIIGVIGFAVDITEYKQLEKKFSECELKMRGIFDQTSQLIGLLTRDGVLMEVNKAALSMVGVAASSVLGKPFWETPWWTHSPELQEKLRQAIKTAAQGELVNFETMHPAKDGTVHFLDFSINPIKDESGKVLFLIPVAWDITERKTLESELSEKEQKMRGIFDQTSQLIGLMSVDGILLKANRAALDFIGIEASAVEGKPFWETPWWTHSVEQQQQLRQSIQSAVGGGFIRFEATHIAKDGSLHFMDFSLRPIKDESGKVILLIPAAHDITELKKALAALQQKESQLDQHNKIWAELTRRDILFEENLEMALKEITEASTIGVDVARASIWLFDPAHLKIVCLDLYERDKARHSQGVELSAKDYPVYFKALETKRIVAADDACQDPLTAEFSNNYLKPLGITSMLDTPIRVGGKIAGVLCHEHIGPQRKWSLEEQNFSMLMADFVSLVIEANERKQMATQLRESEEKYKNVVDNIGIGVALISPQMEILSLNAQMRKWFPNIEVSQKPICYKAFNAPPRDDRCVYCPTFKTLQDGQTHEAMTETPAGDKIINFRIISSAVKDKDGKVLSAVEMVEDITERKKIENAVIEKQEYLESVIDTMGDPVFVKDEHHNWVLLNQAFCEFMGYSRENLLNKSDYDFFPKQEADVFWQKDEKVLTTGREDTNEEELTDRKGITHTILTKKTLYTNLRGEKFIVGTIRDITDRKSSEMKLKDNFEELRNFHEVAIDRENMMINLKKEINKLSEEMGRPKPYDLSFLGE